MTNKILIDRKLLERVAYHLCNHYAAHGEGDKERTELRAAIVAPQQEAVAWYCDAHGYTDNKDDAESWRDRGMPVTEYYLHPAPSIPEGWQPISTAPKDGTKLLLCIEGFEASTGCFHPDFGRWTTFPIDEFEEKEWERWFDENEYKPTLWMRLPTLSAASKPPNTEKYRNGVLRSTVCDCGVQMLAGEVCSVCGYKIGPTTDDRKDAERS